MVGRINKVDMATHPGVPQSCPDCGGDTVRIIVGFPVAKCDDCNRKLN